MKYLKMALYAVLTIAIGLSLFFICSDLYDAYYRHHSKVEVLSVVKPSTLVCHQVHETKVEDFIYTDHMITIKTSYEEFPVNGTEFKKNLERALDVHPFNQNDVPLSSQSNSFSQPLTDPNIQ